MEYLNFFMYLFNLLILSLPSASDETKIKIGLLVPLTGDNSEIGKQIVNAVQLALKDINFNQIEVYPKDTNQIQNILYALLENLSRRV